MSPENSIVLYEASQQSQPRPTSNKRQRIISTCQKRLCDPTKTEKIHQALAKLIATNQLPLSFCSSVGFQHFMAVVEPNYKVCKEEALKKRLIALKTTVVEKVKENLRKVNSVVCTTDCWSSLSQDSYITVTAHFINSVWERESYVLTTHEVEERHTAQNIADELQQTFDEWDLNNKVLSIVTDNAKNMINAVALLAAHTDISNITCAAHSMQLAVNASMKAENIQQLLQHCSKVVGHFKHSNVAKKALERKQHQLSMSPTTLLQSCSTRWNSTYFMLERLYANRCPIANVIADRSITSASVAEQLEITERQWRLIESLINILKPLQVVTTIFCGESNSPVSMVRPLLTKVVEKHLRTNDNTEEPIRCMKEVLVEELTKRFKLKWTENGNDFASKTQLACFFDPRYKDLDHETFNVRDMLRHSIRAQLELTPVRATTTEKSEARSALQFLYDEVHNENDLSAEIETYMAEPQLRFDLDPYEWWKARERKYPTISEIAKKYLAIPATSVMSERCFSSAGNIVTSKRNRLLPENVNMLVFLYQNRKLMD